MNRKKLSISWLCLKGFRERLLSQIAKTQDHRIGIDLTSIRHFCVGLMSNRCRSDGLCYLDHDLVNTTLAHGPIFPSGPRRCGFAPSQSLVRRAPSIWYSWTQRVSCSDKAGRNLWRYTRILNSLYRLSFWTIRIFYGSRSEPVCVKDRRISSTALWPLVKRSVTQDTNNCMNLNFMQISWLEVRLTLEVSRDFSRSRQPFWMTSSDKRELSKIIDSKRSFHNDVIKWKHFPCYRPFVRGIHWSPVNSPYKSQLRGALMFSLIYAWINGWVNNRKAGDLRRHRAHYDVTVMRRKLV